MRRNFIFAHHFGRQVFSFLFNSVIGRELVKLLKIPFDHYKEITRLLDLPSYADVLSLLEFRGRTHICSTFISNMLENETRIEDENRMEMVGFCLAKNGFFFIFN